MRKPKNVSLIASLIASALSTLLVAPLLTMASAGAATRATPLLVAAVPGSSSIYVVAARSCPSALCLDLERTDDLGASYAARTLPPVAGAPGSSTGTLKDLVFANVSDGYALEGTGTPRTLWVTTDGARSWHKQRVAAGSTIFSVTTSGSRLYAVVATCTGPADDRTCSDFRLGRSGLAGSHWSFALLPGTKLRYGTFDGTVAADGTHVWVSEQTQLSIVYSSTNAGESWRSRSELDLASVSGCALTAESASVLWAGCPTGMMESFYYSSDGGLTWRPVVQQGYSGTGGGFFAPVSATTAYLDYGETARNVFRVSAPSLRETHVGDLVCTDVASVAFTSESDGAAVCSKDSGTTLTTVLEVTSDGGAHWQSRSVPAA